MNLVPLEATGAPPQPVYVSFREERISGTGRPVTSRRATSTHARHTIKFYLIDTHAQEIVAVTGEDQGDAHYIYTNESGFPALEVHNKRKVEEFLHCLIHASQERAGYHTGVVLDEVPADSNEIKLPDFVAYRQEKLADDTGRHVLRYWLVDTSGGEHLAVVGEEKDTRDGHYAYHTVGVFDVKYPLEESNQTAVHIWLNHMTQHGGLVENPSYAMGPSRPGTGLMLDAGTPITFSAQPIRRGPGRPALKRAGKGTELLRQATTNWKRRGPGHWRQALHPDQEVRELVAAELRKWAGEEGIKRDLMKQQALSFLKYQLSADETLSVERCLAILKGAAVASERRAGAKDQDQLRATVGALRDLSHMPAPLDLIGVPGLKETLHTIAQKHQNKMVATLANDLLELWLKTAVAHVHVLAHPRYEEDPRSAIESKIADEQTLDPIVSAVAHKSLQPLRLLAMEQQQQQQELWSPAITTPGLGTPSTPEFLAGPNVGTFPKKHGMDSTVSRGGEPSSLLMTVPGVQGISEAHILQSPLPESVAEQL